MVEDQNNGLRQRQVEGSQGDQKQESAEETRRPKRKMNDRCRRILLSWQFKASIFSVVAVVPVYGTFIVLPVILERRECTDAFCHLRHTIFAIWISVQFLYNFGMTQFSDPGGCKYIKPTYEATGQFEMILSGDLKEGQPKSMLYAPNFCEHCQHWKPPRAHHCSFCRRCVLRMDHHCPFTGNCIGMRNHGHFLLMYVFACVGLLYCLTQCVLVVASAPSSWSIFKPHEFSKTAPMLRSGLSGMMANITLQVLEVAGWKITLLTVFASVAFVAVTGFGVPVWLTAMEGATVLEHHFPMKEYVQIKPQVYCPLGPGFYRQKVQQNIKDLIGARWWLRLLLPTRGGPVNVRPAVSPVPSVQGVALLLQRVREVEEQGVEHEVKSYKDLGINCGPSADGTNV
mmetsp:Transcript_33442/g.73166  ORF Transcript_33442/g.73166 Transcript_33442/m.73166 type:complete len:399 (+) Transcript_33442:30-1226(+)|eukprot:CAMPEP_0170600430 /NCGR_PEP_ID=MMETSP0224-20130122/17329_1 /TAXON_ID=285029 /ORGANISM="Togula jolla, Strain CCCM 725" /LENGTH=398 /DNA_ID=CAMNT_0010925153 /DNA_START=23 /DNA_END=1219 /DNA_ORIENTATION=+